MSTFFLLYRIYSSYKLFLGIHFHDINNAFICIANCGIRHLTVPIATRILIANVRHIGLSNICVINLVYFKMQV